MDYQANDTISLLNESYTFQSVSGKNINFEKSVSNMPFFFRSNNAQSRESLCVHAGGEITYTTPVKFLQASLPYTMLLFVKSGEANILYQEETLLLSKNDIALFPAGRDLRFTTSHTPFSYVLFYISGTICKDFLPLLCGKNHYYKKKHSSDSIFFRLLPSILNLLPSMDDISGLHLSTMLHLALSSLVDAKEQEASHARLPKHVAQMKQIFDTDYQNPHPLEELENTIGINKYRLCRDFSKSIGTPPVQYLTQVRLRQAEYLLRSSNLTIHEVGSAVGIDNTTHFINLFKKNAGITPLQFRQNHSH